MKKTTNKDISVTHVSEKTIVTINGKEVSMDNISGNNELMSLLKNNNLDENLISDLMNASTNNAQVTNTNSTNNKFTKIECTSCHRTVSFGKGNCMYCGNTLELQTVEQNNKTTNKVDEKYLNTEKISTEKEVSNADLNYIDRLKDI